MATAVGQANVIKEGYSAEFATKFMLFIFVVLTAILKIETFFLNLLGAK